MKLLKLIHILLKEKVDADDLTDLWLILFFYTTVEELLPKYKTGIGADKQPSYDTIKFYSDHEVKDWQYKVWHRIAFYKVRRIEAGWYLGKLFPFITRYLPSKAIAEKRFSWVTLQCSPNTKSKNY